MTIIRITYPDNLVAQGLCKTESIEVPVGTMLSPLVEERAEKIEVVNAAGDILQVLKDRQGPTS